MDDLAAFVQAGQLTLSGLGALGVLLVFLGRMIPRSTVDALLATRDAEITRSNARADEWHAAYETERTGRELVTEQNRELIEVARTVEHVMESLQAKAEGRGYVAPPD